MGSAVSITPINDVSSSKFSQLLGDHEQLTRLYSVISAYGHTEGKINLKNKISLTEMLLYIEKGENPIFMEVFPNCPPVVIKTAYEYVINSNSQSKPHHYKKSHSSSSSAASTSKQEMNQKQFLQFLPVVYLFYHLWKIFDIADSSIEDRRIFPNEFLHVKYTIESIPGVHLTAITREEWENEFTILDKNKDGYITFNEFCKYVMSKIITPAKYMEAFKKFDDDNSLNEPLISSDTNADGTSSYPAPNMGSDSPCGGDDQNESNSETERITLPLENYPKPNSTQIDPTDSQPPTSPPPPHPSVQHSSEPSSSKGILENAPASSPRDISKSVPGSGDGPIHSPKNSPRRTSPRANETNEMLSSQSTPSLSTA